jgi:energy-coupling factor transporter ATP-binding protein EcfA2
MLQAHVAVFGQTGSGKTVLLRSIVADALLHKTAQTAILFDLEDSLAGVLEELQAQDAFNQVELRLFQTGKLTEGVPALTLVPFLSPPGAGEDTLFKMSMAEQLENFCRLVVPKCAPKSATDSLTCENFFRRAINEALTPEIVGDLKPPPKSVGNAEEIIQATEVYLVKTVRDFQAGLISEKEKHVTIVFQKALKDWLRQPAVDGFQQQPNGEDVFEISLDTFTQLDRSKVSVLNVISGTHCAESGSTQNTLMRMMIQRVLEVVSCAKIDDLYKYHDDLLADRPPLSMMLVFDEASLVFAPLADKKDKVLQDKLTDTMTKGMMAKFRHTKICALMATQTILGTKKLGCIDYPQTIFMSKVVTPKHAAIFLGGKAGGAESVMEFKNTVLADLHTPSFFLHTVGLLSQSKHQGWVNVPFNKRRAVTLKEISGLLDKRRGEAPFHAPPAVAWAPLGGRGAPEGSRAGEERVAASRAQMHAAAAEAAAGDVGRNDEQLALRAATDRSLADAPAQEEAHQTAATQEALSTPTRATAEPNADAASDAGVSTAKKRKREREEIK